MKHLIASATLAICLAATPALAGALSDPILEQDLIVQEAIADAGKQDALIVAVFLATAMAALGGAF